MQRITSKDNQKIKLLSKLISSQKERDESGLFVLEGLRLIADAISAGLKILELYVAESYLGKAEVEIFALLPESVEIIAIDDFILPKITDTKTPQGIVALAQGSLLEENLPESMAGGALLLCGLQDPGNMGTLLRSAAAFSLSA
ncbi:MAG: RNA methyltransferase substrate-binding domain-containing protein, partial [Oscillospiraceae bacterium]